MRDSLVLRRLGDSRYIPTSLVAGYIPGYVCIQRILHNSDDARRNIKNLRCLGVINQIMQVSFSALFPMPSLQ